MPPQCIRDRVALTNTEEGGHVVRKAERWSAIWCKWGNWRSILALERALRSRIIEIMKGTMVVMVTVGPWVQV